MDDLELLSLLVQEAQYPQFSEDELEAMLKLNDNNVYLTASTICKMKANGDKKITVGPITIEGPGADYWLNLSEEYSVKGAKTNSSSTTSGYITRMKRC